MERTCPGCGTPVALGLYGCAACWARLPQPYKHAINAAWRNRHARRPGANEAHERAKQAANGWFARNPA